MRDLQFSLILLDRILIPLGTGQYSYCVKSKRFQSNKILAGIICYIDDGGRDLADLFEAIGRGLAAADSMSIRIEALFNKGVET